ncbi:MAG TPA: TPM domain-containing protein [Chitinophagaceae bacterium]|nr:TPM domain-containing protein [Chitinophagaceae bacterium]
MAIFRKKEFFTEKQKSAIVEAIRGAERMTSGEIRLYVEHRCKYLDPMHRAMEVFSHLELHKRIHRNAVLLYIALADKQFAIYGDEGIHAKVGDNFWQKQADLLKQQFRDGKITEGIAVCILGIGTALQQYFPHDLDQNSPEPDEILYGR